MLELRRRLHADTGIGLFQYRSAPFALYDDRLGCLMHSIFRAGFVVGTGSVGTLAVLMSNAFLLLRIGQAFVMSCAGQFEVSEQLSALVGMIAIAGTFLRTAQWLARQPSRAR